MVDQLEDKNPYGFKPVSSRRVSEAIFDQIREKILRGEIRPNDRLPSERALMEIFGRSRPTIREALRMLERSGLITTIPGSGGSVVKEISSQTVEQSLEGMVLQKSITPSTCTNFARLMKPPMSRGLSSAAPRKIFWICAGSSSVPKLVVMIGRSFSPAILIFTWLWPGPAKTRCRPLFTPSFPN